VWGRDDLAVVNSRWFNTRHETRFVVDPSNPGEGRVLLERNYQARYDDPGQPVTQPNAAGRPVIRFTPDGKILMQGAGATPQGAQSIHRPHVPRAELEDLSTLRARQPGGGWDGAQEVANGQDRD
jgi:hypothetical protein